MSTYEELHGKRVEVFDEDPTLDSSYEGQVWYNSATGTLKTVISFSAFTSSTPVSTGRRGMSSSKNGTQNAMFGSSGYTGGSAPYATSQTEEYNGLGWSIGGNIINQRDGGTGAGTLTAGLAMGAVPPASPAGPGNKALTEEYDGSSWTAGGAMSNGRASVDMGCGVQTAAMIAGGILPPGGLTNATEHYNGSSWTSGGTMSDSRKNHSGCGIQTAAVTFAGDLGPPGLTNQSQEYNGTSRS